MNATTSVVATAAKPIYASAVPIVAIALFSAVAYSIVVAPYAPERATATFWTGAIIAFLLIVMSLCCAESTLSRLILLSGLVGILAIPTFGAPLSLKAPLAIILCMLVAVHLTRFGARIEFGVPQALFIALMVYTTVSAAAFGAVEVVLGLVLQALTVGPVAFGLLVAERRVVREFLVVILLLSSVESVWAVMNATGRLPLVWGVLGDTLGATGQVNNLIPDLTIRGSGSFAHPLPCGVWLAFSVLIALAVPNIRAIFRVALCTLFVVGILFTGTRSALILSLIILTYFAVLRIRKSSHSLQVGAIVCFVFGVIVATLSWSAIAHRVGLGQVASTASFYQRRDSASAFLSLFDASFREVLFGSDPGELASRPEFVYLTTNKIFAIDNQWVSSFAACGLVGLCLLLSCVLSLAVRSRIGLISAVFLFGTALSYGPLDWSTGLLMWIILVQPVFYGIRKSRPRREIETSTDESLPVLALDDVPGAGQSARH